MHLQNNKIHSVARFIGCCRGRKGEKKRERDGSKKRMSWFVHVTIDRRATNFCRCFIVYEKKKKHASE